MTEDEAKTKWCPFARVGSGAGFNRDFDRPEADPTFKGTGCIASACMAWRWTRSPEWVESAKIEAPMRHAERPFTTDGFCGLAGPPQ